MDCPKCGELAVRDFNKPVTRHDGTRGKLSWNSETQEVCCGNCGVKLVRNTVVNRVWRLAE